MLISLNIIGSFFVTFFSEVLWGFLNDFGVLRDQNHCNSPRPATQWTDNLPRDATMIYFIDSIMSRFRTKHFGFIIVSFTARWTGKMKRKKLDSSQEPCPVPSSSLELTSAVAVLAAAKLLLSNVRIPLQGASFLLSKRQFYISFFLNQKQNIIEVYW